jgi:hypothetical protein
LAQTDKFGNVLEFKRDLPPSLLHGARARQLVVSKQDPAVNVTNFFTNSGALI